MSADLLQCQGLPDKSKVKDKLANMLVYFLLNYLLYNVLEGDD